MAARRGNNRRTFDLEFAQLGHIVKDGPPPKPSPKTRYSYEAITSKSTIRLLTLYPGKGEIEVLRGSLRSAQLETPGPYDALSYTWGSGDKPFSIEIDDHVLPITESAHRLLMRVRSPVEATTVWIDSICINQADNDEKSLQVAAMGNIFMSATRVLCWLGDDDDGDGAATFDLIYRVAEADFTVLRDDLLTYAFMDYNHLPPSRDPQWKAASRFFRRPWFRRQWVVQEVILGTDVIIMCGNLEAHWMSLVPGLNLLVQYSMISWGAGLSSSEDDESGLYGPTDAPDEHKGIITFQMMMVLKVYRTPGGDLDDAMRHMLNRDQNALAVRLSTLAQLQFETRLEVFNAAFAMLAGHSDTSVVRTHVALLRSMGADISMEAMNQSTGLNGLASLFPCCIATDPRDRFYAFLSLSKERDEPTLQPDYSESTRATYLRFARYTLLGPDAGVGMPLIMAGTTSHGPQLSLPSWLCDFTHTPHIKFLTGPGNQGCVYKASGDTGRGFTATDDVDELAVTAGCIDVVSRVTPQPSYPPESEDEWRAFLDRLDEMTVLRGTPYPYAAPGETWLNVQWRTLIGNGDISCMAAPDESWEHSYMEDREKFELFASDLEQWREMPETVDKVLSLDWGVRWSLLSRRCSLCETEGGLIGLVPNGAKVGDAVWIILGESMPFLLRQRSENSGKYEIFGACYMHGIMNGEAMTADSWKEERIVLL